MRANFCQCGHQQVSFKSNLGHGRRKRWRIFFAEALARIKLEES